MGREVGGGFRSGLPFPSPEDPPDSGTQPASSALQADSYPLYHQESSIVSFF